MEMNSQLNKCCKPAEKQSQNHYIIDWIESKSGRIPRISTQLTKTDHWQNIKVRWGINRMNHKVNPGLYAIGNPSGDSPVLVTANYKLSFDMLRKELTEIDSWILVLDTKGVNVWCAAGKGTFGTKELVGRIRITKLEKLISHKKLIVPQLGATGISAHEVKRLSGFSVTYGPVRATDIPAFINLNHKATPSMRRITFSLYNRLQVIPVEIRQGIPRLFLLMAGFLLLSGMTKAGYSLTLWGSIGLFSMVNLLFAFFAGVFLAPVLLPWIPGRSFSLKGLIAGLAMFLIAHLIKITGHNTVVVISWLFIFLALSSFLTMNYTGASTYTSLSGVKKEMRLAVPLQVIAAVIGLSLWIAGKFL
jgi:acetyl-CoA decarbonylase/synthase complex subunit gamma